MIAELIVEFWHFLALPLSGAFGWALKLRIEEYFHNKRKTPRRATDNGSRKETEEWVTRKDFEGYKDFMGDKITKLTSIVVTVKEQLIEVTTKLNERTGK